MLNKNKNWITYLFLFVCITIMSTDAFIEKSKKFIEKAKKTIEKAKKYNLL